MQEHPIPQNVTGYEFHLIGQMTLKQFMEVALGIGIAVLLNLTNLPVIFKYPFMVLSVLIGAALAFIPFEGRPLDRWFLAFIRSIYQPTMFFWKKTDTTPPVFAYSAPSGLDRTPQVDYGPLKQTRMDEFLTTMRPATAAPDEESQAAAVLLSLFSEPVKTTSSITPPPSPPTTQPSTIVSKAEPVVIQPAVFPTANTFAQKEVVVMEGNPATHIAPQTLVVPASTQTPIASPTAEVVTSSPQTAPIATKTAMTNTTLPFPIKATQPNMIIGMTINAQQKIITSAIVTIHRKADGVPVRALKTNMLGQFSITTPLANGEYVLTTEKDGQSFDAVNLTMDGSILDPILIQAKK